MPKNLFITGCKRSGKSTLLKNMIDPIVHLTGGYFVQRLFIQGESRAFRLVDITSESYLPNRHVQDLEGFSDLIAVMSKGKIFHYDTFKTIGISALKQACEKKQLVLMDELGRIEIMVPDFMQTVFSVLDSEVPVLGVLKKESNPFLDQIRARIDVEVIDMDACGSDCVRDEVQQFLISRQG